MADEKVILDPVTKRLVRIRSSRPLTQADIDRELGLTGDRISQGIESSTTGDVQTFIGGSGDSVVRAPRSATPKLSLGDPPPLADVVARAPSISQYTIPAKPTMPTLPPKRRREDPNYPTISPARAPSLQSMFGELGGRLYEGASNTVQQFAPPEIAPAKSTSDFVSRVLPESAYNTLRGLVTAPVTLPAQAIVTAGDMIAGRGEVSRRLAAGDAEGAEKLRRDLNKEEGKALLGASPLGFGQELGKAVYGGAPDGSVINAAKRFGTAVVDRAKSDPVGLAMDVAPTLAVSARAARPTLARVGAQVAPMVREALPRVSMTPPKMPTIPTLAELTNMNNWQYTPGLGAAGGGGMRFSPSQIAAMNAKKGKQQKTPLSSMMEGYVLQGITNDQKTLPRPFESVPLGVPPVSKLPASVRGDLIIPDYVKTVDDFGRIPANILRELATIPNEAKEKRLRAADKLAINTPSDLVASQRQRERSPIEFITQLQRAIEQDMGLNFQGYDGQKAGLDLATGTFSEGGLGHAYLPGNETSLTANRPGGVEATQNRITGTGVSSGAKGLFNVVGLMAPGTEAGNPMAAGRYLQMLQQQALGGRAGFTMPQLQKIVSGVNKNLFEGVRRDGVLPLLERGDAPVRNRQVQDSIAKVRALGLEEKTTNKLVDTVVSDYLDGLTAATRQKLFDSIDSPTSYKFIERGGIQNALDFLPKAQFKWRLESYMKTIAEANPNFLPLGSYLDSQNAFPRSVYGSTPGMLVGGGFFDENNPLATTARNAGVAGNASYELNFLGAPVGRLPYGVALPVQGIMREFRKGIGVDSDGRPILGDPPKDWGDLWKSGPWYVPEKRKPVVSGVLDQAIKELYDAERNGNLNPMVAAAGDALGGSLPYDFSSPGAGRFSNDGLAGSGKYQGDSGSQNPLANNAGGSGNPSSFGRGFDIGSSVGALGALDPKLFATTREFLSRLQQDFNITHAGSSPLSINDGTGASMRAGTYERIGGAAGKQASDIFRDLQEQVDSGSRPDIALEKAKRRIDMLSTSLADKPGLVEEFQRHLAAIENDYYQGALKKKQKATKAGDEDAIARANLQLEAMKPTLGTTEKQIGSLITRLSDDKIGANEAGFWLRSQVDRATALGNILRLKYNIKSSAINLLQPLETLWPRVSTADYARITAESLKPSTRKRLEELGVVDGATKLEESARVPLDRALANEISLDEDFMKLVSELEADWAVKEFDGVEIPEKEGPKRIPKTLAERVKAASPFTAASAQNRIMGYLYGELDAKKKGITDPDQIHRNGLAWAEIVEFDNSTYNAPPILRSTQAKLLLQYKGFTLKSLENLADLATAPGTRVQRAARLAKWGTAKGTTGGVKVLAMWPAGAVGLAAYAYARDMFKARGMSEEEAQKAAEGVYFGLPALVGADISSSVGILEEPFGETPNDKLVSGLMGPTISSVANLMKMKEEDRNPIDIAARFSPYVKQGVAISDMITGKNKDVMVSKNDANKKGSRPPTLSEMALRGLAVPLAAQSGAYADKDLLKGLQKEIAGLDFELLMMNPRHASKSRYEQDRMKLDSMRSAERDFTDLKRARATAEKLRAKLQTKRESLASGRG